MATQFLRSSVLTGSGSGSVNVRSLWRILGIPLTDNWPRVLLDRCAKERADFRVSFLKVLVMVVDAGVRGGSPRKCELGGLSSEANHKP